jgi:radical SAM protein with 4Fe4S-binding SPASM domain
MSTNGILLDSYLKHKIVLESCEWMRFNISAYTEEGYRDIHKSSQRNVVFQNVRDMANLKKEEGYKCDLGIQMVFDPSSMLDEVIPLSKFAIDAGVDYFVIKQCSLPDNGESGIKQFDVKQYDDVVVQDVLKEAESLSTDKTDIIPKWNIMDLKGEKPYEKCLAFPVLCEISGDGDFYGCGYFFGGKRTDLRFGNIHDNSLEEIINSNKYWEVVNYMETQFDPKTDCKGGCRSDSINIFLDEYVNNRPSGLNFI